MAPTCHVQVGAVASFDQHPMAAMLRAGFNVGVNTDNRLMSGVSASSELAALSAAFELTDAECRQLQVNAAMASFAPRDQRLALAASM